MIKKVKDEKHSSKFNQNEMKRKKLKCLSKKQKIDWNLPSLKKESKHFFFLD